MFINFDDIMKLTEFEKIERKFEKIYESLIPPP